MKVFVTARTFRSDLHQKVRKTFVKSSLGLFLEIEVKFVADLFEEGTIGKVRREVIRDFEATNVNARANEDSFRLNHPNLRSLQNS